MHGLYACRFSTAMLSVCLLLICSGHRQLVEKMKILLLLTGPILAGFAITALATTGTMVKDFRTDPMLAFGLTQDYFSLGVLSVSLMVTLVCLVMKHKIR